MTAASTGTDRSALVQALWALKPSATSETLDARLASPRASLLGHLTVRAGAETRLLRTSRVLAHLAGGHADRTWDKRLRELTRPCRPKKRPGRVIPAGKEDIRQTGPAPGPGELPERQAGVT